jgi:hypothetical protein
MFTQAKVELKELMKLTHELATLDATHAARPDIVPGDGYAEKRARMQDRKIELASKYEIL